IYGNNDGIEPGKVIPELLEDGYTVLAVPMLNYGYPAPEGIICGFNNHDQFFLNSNYPYALSYFFKPLIASLNLLGRANFQSIYMTGLSGGGWT
ncbi:hypothetical protein, partial [Salmonella sp. SAL4436]|uniref:hypothetical protein n=1 Tax=Salmonella sp. SAL4436 TaxID=3159891 RepID=UPI00397B7B34